MRLGAAVLLVGVALAGAAYLSSTHLGRGAYICGGHGYDPFLLTCKGVGTGLGPQHYGPVHYGSIRAAWQTPVAILIISFGLGAAVVIARRPPSGADMASSETT